MHANDVGQQLEEKKEWTAARGQKGLGRGESEVGSTFVWLALGWRVSELVRR